MSKRKVKWKQNMAARRSDSQQSQGNSCVSTAVWNMACLALPAGPQGHVIISTSMFPSSNSSTTPHTWKPQKKNRKLLLFLPPYGAFFLKKSLFMFGVLASFQPCNKNHPISSPTGCSPRFPEGGTLNIYMLTRPLNNNQRISSCECFVSHPWRETSWHHDRGICRTTNPHLLLDP